MKNDAHSSLDHHHRCITNYPYLTTLPYLTLPYLTNYPYPYLTLPYLTLPYPYPYLTCYPTSAWTNTFVLKNGRKTERTVVVIS